MACELMFTLVLLAQATSTTATTPNITAPATTPQVRTIGTIRAEIDACLQAESLAESNPARVLQIRRLVEIHQEITSDARFSDSEVMQSLRTRVWARLLKVRDEMKRKLAIAEKKQKRSTPVKNSSQQDATHSAASELLVTSNQMLSGPNGWIARGGGAVTDDFSEELIELIQHTINPASWAVNGGQATIYYYRPVMALVVRASSEVHENLGHALDALR